MDDTPVELWEPAIINGYRSTNQPWSYYLKSLFQMHNETINVWTHLIGFVAIWISLGEYTKEYNFWTDKHSWPILIFGSTSLILCLGSALAHLLHSRSVHDHYVIFMLDYAGAALYAFGSGIQSFYGCSDKTTYELLDNIYLPAQIIITLLNFSVLCFAKLCYGQDPHNLNRHLMFISIMAVQLILSTVPFGARYYQCYQDETCSISSLNHMTILWILYLLAGFFFGCHYPERLFPGKCDSFGQGHQIFHVLITVNQILQLRAMHIDIESGDAEHTDPNILTLMLSFVFIIVSDIGIFFLFKRKIVKPYLNVKKTS